MAAVQRIQPLAAQNQANAPIKFHAQQQQQHGRRAMISTGLAAALISSLGGNNVANAKDIPLFGIKPKKEVESIVKSVQDEAKVLVKEAQSEVKELVKEGQNIVKEGQNIVKEGENIVMSAEYSASFPAATQAGALLAAEVLAVAVASSVVNGLVAQGSK